MGLDSSFPPHSFPPLKKKKNLVKGRKYASEKKNTRRRPSAITLESWEVENEKAIGLSFTATMAFYEGIRHSQGSWYGIRGARRGNLEEGR